MKNNPQEKTKLWSFVSGITYAIILSGTVLPIAGILFLIYVSHDILYVITICTLIIALNLFFLRRISKYFLANLKKFSFYYETLSKGNLPGQVEAPVLELKEMSKHLNETTTELKNIRLFFEKIGRGELDNDIKVFNDEGELGTTLLGVREELKKVALLNWQRNWVNEGLSMMAEVLRNNTELNELCDAVMASLVKYVNANQGKIFIVNEENPSHPHLELKSTYAYNRKRYNQKLIEPGEGLAGQAWLEMDTIYLTEIPQNYTTIRSGLGEATPTSLLIVPLKNDEKVQGIIEIASFVFFQDFEIRFVEKIAENISISISNSKKNQKTTLLLEETQQMAEQMQAQEEEMRQNMEELQATQEEMHRNTQEIILKEANLNSLINNIGAAVVSIDQNFIILAVNNEMISIYEKMGIHFKAGDNAIEKLPEKDKVYRKKLYLRAFAGEEFSVTEEIKMPGQEGIVYMKISHIPIFNDLKQVTGVTVFAKNITADVMLKNNLEHQQALLEGLINNTDDNIMALDRNYNVTIINDRYKERYKAMGYDYGVGINAFKVMDASIHEEWKGYYDRALNGERFAFRKTFNDGQKTIEREYSFNPIKNSLGEVVGLSIFNRLVG